MAVHWKASEMRSVSMQEPSTEFTFTWGQGPTLSTIKVALFTNVSCTGGFPGWIAERDAVLQVLPATKDHHHCLVDGQF